MSEIDRMRWTERKSFVCFLRSWLNRSIFFPHTSGRPHGTPGEFHTKTSPLSSVIRLNPTHYNYGIVGHKLFLNSQKYDCRLYLNGFIATFDAIVFVILRPKSNIKINLVVLFREQKAAIKTILLTNMMNMMMREIFIGPNNSYCEQTKSYRKRTGTQNVSSQQQEKTRLFTLIDDLTSTHKQTLSLALIHCFDFVLRIASGRLIWTLCLSFMFFFSFWVLNSTMAINSEAYNLNSSLLSTN